MTSIPFDDFGGDGPVVHFAHANGYPPGCYRQLIQHLTPLYHVLAVHHRPLWPGATMKKFKSWATITNDLIQFCDEQGLRGILGVGHSLGAVATMFAALKRPELFRALVLIEPVFLPPKLLFWARLTPHFIRYRFTPITQVALKRRDVWESKEALFASYRSKKVFARLSDEVLWDFVTHGTMTRPDGQQTLVYSKEWEALIYSHPPQVWRPLKQLSLPTLGIRGADSDTISPEAWQKWQAIQPNQAFIEFPEAGHLVPMERPAEVADHILNFFDQGWRPRTAE